MNVNGNGLIATQKIVLTEEQSFNKLSDMAFIYIAPGWACMIQTPKDKAHDLHTEAFKLAANFIYNHPDKKILHNYFQLEMGECKYLEQKNTD